MLNELKAIPPGLYFFIIYLKQSGNPAKKIRISNLLETVERNTVLNKASR